MKIGLFTDTYFPDVNGVVTVVQLMARELRKVGHEVHIFAPAYPQYTDDDPHVHRFPSVRAMLYQGMRLALPVIGRKTHRLISHLDILHSHDPFSVGQVAFWASWQYRIPHLHTYHALYTEMRRYVPVPLRPPRRAVERISRAFCNLCEGVIAPSQAVAAELRSYGVTVPIYTVPFGVDEEEFARPVEWNARRELSLEGRDLLLFAGRLGWEKNLEFLLRTFRVVHATRPEAQLVIAGGGPQTQRLRAYATELALGEAVMFLGPLPRPKLIDLYRQADLFVFPSKLDAGAIVLSEAQMGGLPVVALARMGTLDLVLPGETGLLVEENEGEFAQACLQLLEDVERRTRMAWAAREYARSRSAAACTAELLKIYGSALATRIRPRQPRRLTRG